MNRKMIIYKDLMETSTATRFNLLSHEDYSFRHSSCLYLRNMITNEKMKLIWRKKTLEIIPNEVKKKFYYSKIIQIKIFIVFFFSHYQLENIFINLNVILFHYNHIISMFNQLYVH